MKDKKPNLTNPFISTIKKKYSKLNVDIEAIRGFDMRKHDLEFAHVVQCAYIKAYDFLMYCCSNKDPESAFFRLPLLRSVCEDLITISYIKNLPEVEIKSFLTELASDDLYQSIIIQEKFFTKYNPAQMIVSSNLIPQAEKAKLLTKPKNKAGAEKAGFAVLPSVAKMAKQTGLEDLYEYLYHATSQLVHFNPNTLLKMGWGDIDPDGTIHAKISYKNYYLYYNAFLVFYASYLFIEQTKTFDSIIALSDNIKKLTNQLESGFKKIDWPEIITFDHLNIKGPNTFQRLTNRVLFDYENGK
jgi:hypothetical protein